MKTLVIYDSLHGNTEQIAESIGRGLSGQNKVLSVKEARAEDMNGVDRLILGSPTQGGKATAGMAEFLSTIGPGALESVKVAAFDTRFSGKLVGLLGNAAAKIMSELSRKGGIVIAAPAGEEASKSGRVGGNP
jgi:flavodoxin